MDMTSTDIEVLKGGITKLLSGVQLAFITSLVGIGFALFYGYWHNDTIKKFKINVQKLSDLIEEIFPLRTSEYWLHENYKESNQQTNLLKNIGVDVAQAIFDGLDQRFDEGISRLCDQIEEKFFPMFEKVCDSISKLSDGGTNALNETMSRFAGSQMQSFADSLNKFTDSVQKSLEDSQKTGETMNKIILATLEEMRTNFSSASKEMEKILTKSATESAIQIENQNNLFQSTISKQNETMEKSYRQMENFMQDTEKILSNIRAATTSIGQAATPLQQSISLLKESLKDNETATKKFLDEISVQINKLATANQISENNIETLVSELQEYEKNIARAWVNYENNFNRVGGELERATNIITQRLQDYNNMMNNGMKQTLEKFDKSVTDAVGLLNSSVDDLQDAVDSIHRKV